MADKKCTCLNCGYEWISGQNGYHNCATVFKAKMEALAKEQFVVVAGKYEPNQDDEDGRNYKFIGEPKSNLTEAIEELKTVVDYQFCEIEFTASNGERFILNPMPNARPIH